MPFEYAIPQIATKFDKDSVICTLDLLDLRTSLFGANGRETRLLHRITSTHNMPMCGGASHEHEQTENAAARSATVCRTKLNCILTLPLGSIIIYVYAYACARARQILVAQRRTMWSASQCCMADRVVYR